MSTAAPDDAFWFEAPRDSLRTGPRELKEAASTPERLAPHEPAPRPNAAPTRHPARGKRPGHAVQPRQSAQAKPSPKRAQHADATEPARSDGTPMLLRSLGELPADGSPPTRRPVARRPLGSPPAVIVPDPPEFAVSRLRPKTWFERRADVIAREAERTAAEQEPEPIREPDTTETPIVARIEPKPAPAVAADVADPPTFVPTPLPPREPDPKPSKPAQIAPWEAQLLAKPSGPRPAPSPPAAPAIPVAAAVAVSAPAQSWGWTSEWGLDTGEYAIARGRGRRHRDDGDSGPRSRRLWLPVGLLAAGACVVVGVTGIPRLSHAPAVPRHQNAAAVRHSDSLGMVAVPAPSPFAMRSIPRRYLKLYIRVGDEYGLNWTMLAAVGQIESRSGRSRLPGVDSGTNFAGAAGPAQFESETWQRFGVNADGRGASSPYDPADAITAMAAYLKASGAPQNWNQALLTYNHSQPYATAVAALAGRYTATGFPPAS